MHRTHKLVQVYPKRESLPVPQPSSTVEWARHARGFIAELLRKIKNFSQSITSIASKSDGTNRCSLQFTNCARIIALPGKRDNIRSFSKVSLLIIDEAAWVPDTLYFAVRPFLARLRQVLSEQNPCILQGGPDLTAKRILGPYSKEVRHMACSVFCHLVLRLRKGSSWN